MNNLLLYLEIFFARIIDVSIGSVRTIYLVKQKNFIACILAFIEIVIWFLVAKEALTGNSNIFVIISYAGGYATGTYLGGLINKYLVHGNFTILIITEKAKEIYTELKENNFGVSEIVLDDQKSIILIEIKKRTLKKAKKIINKLDRKAFVIVNESLDVENGYII